VEPQRNKTIEALQLEMTTLKKAWGWFYFLMTVILGGMSFLIWMALSQNFRGVTPSFPDTFVIVFITLLLGSGAIWSLWRNYSVQISASGVRVSTLSGQKFVQWSEVRAIERDEGITLLTAKGGGISFSPYVFESPHELYEFIETNLRFARVGSDIREIR
jgi:hypothetical protein